jgi:exopolyphosphatase / guanosine-5'-triphosphate,3'-diphosphate pyrophosphatase
MKYEDSFSRMLFVGAGGNINTIAKLYGRIPEKILPLANLEYAIRQLKSFTLQQRIELLELKPDRADVIEPAATIFHFIMKTTGAQTLLVPRIGLSDGIVSLLYSEVRKTVAR